MSITKDNLAEKINGMKKEDYKKFALEVFSALLSDITKNAAPSMFGGNKTAIEIGESAAKVRLSLEAAAPENAKASAIEAIHTQLTKGKCPYLTALINETMAPLRALPVNA